MWMIHISDLHFSRDIKQDKINNIMKSFYKKIKDTIPKKEKVIIVNCGDVIDKGDKGQYKIASTFFKNLKPSLTDYDISIVTCPGNHDLINKSFSDFDLFNFDITQNTGLTFNSENIKSLVIDDNAFVIVNSTYHLDYSYGQVDISSLSNELSKINKVKNKILILHHHLIPVDISHRSAVSNAYEVLKLCDKYDIRLVLHGHQHMKIDINICNNNFLILGVGSLLAEVGTNYHNQFNIISLNDKELIVKKFIYNNENIDSGIFGDFEEEKGVCYEKS